MIHRISYLSYLNYGNEIVEHTLADSATDFGHEMELVM